MWRAGLRVGETVALELRDIDLTADTLLVSRGKGGRGRTVPLHPDLASLFAGTGAVGTVVQRRLARVYYEYRDERLGTATRRGRKAGLQL